MMKQLMIDELMKLVNEWESSDKSEFIVDLLHMLTPEQVAVVYASQHLTAPEIVSAGEHLRGGV